MGRYNCDPDMKTQLKTKTVMTSVSQMTKNTPKMKYQHLSNVKINQQSFPDIVIKNQNIVVNQDTFGLKLKKVFAQNGIVEKNVKNDQNVRVIKNLTFMNQMAVKLIPVLRKNRLIEVLCLQIFVVECKIFSF